MWCSNFRWQSHVSQPHIRQLLVHVPCTLLLMRSISQLIHVSTHYYLLSRVYFLNILKKFHIKNQKRTDDINLYYYLFYLTHLGKMPGNRNTFRRQINIYSTKMSSISSISNWQLVSIRSHKLCHRTYKNTQFSTGCLRSIAKAFRDTYFKKHYHTFNIIHQQQVRVKKTHLDQLHKWETTTS